MEKLKAIAIYEKEWKILQKLRKEKGLTWNGIIKFLLGRRGK